MFFARNVTKTRDELDARGAKFGKFSDGEFQLTNARDPDGNWLQLSNR